MKIKFTLLACAGLFALLLLNSYSSGYTSSTGNDGTGASSGGGCSCHGATTSLGTFVELDSAGIAVTSYKPGKSYTVKISAINGTASFWPYYGFQIATVKLTGAGTSSCVQAGTWGTSLPISVKTTNSSLSLSIAEQSAKIAATTGTGSNGSTYIQSIPWTAPAAGTGSIKIYGIVNAVSGTNGSGGGDQAQKATAITITEAVAPVLVAGVSIAQTVGTNPSCAGSSVTFTATPTNGGTTPTYQWKVNGNNAGVGATFTTATLTNGQIVTCVMTSNLSGVTGSPATSSGITMSITPTVTPSLNITNPTTTFCAGTNTTFTANPTNGGIPTYVWKLNGVTAGTNSATFASSALKNNDSVSCIMTSTATCASPSTVTSTNTIKLTVNQIDTPSISISTPQLSVCAGANVALTATIKKGGTTPSYQWKVNGANAGNGSTFSSNVLTNGAVVTCVLTSNAGCAVNPTAASNSLTISIITNSAPAVNVTTTTAGVLCQGASVDFSATPTNGGSAPTYQWKVNGTNSAVGATFSSSNLNNGDIVNCVMTSNSSCASPLTATSNNDTVKIVPTVVPAIVITALDSSVCAGEAVSFSSNTTLAGTTPYYQWKVNGANAGNGSTFSSTTLTNGAVISCELTSSQQCASPSKVNSGSINVTINSLPTPIVNQSGSTLTSSIVGSSYKWLNGSSVIQSETNVSFNPSVAGNYAVEVTDANGCKGTSSLFSYLVSSVDEISQFYQLNIFPNPARNIINVQASHLEGNCTLEAISISGRLVIQKEANLKNGVLNENLPIHQLTSGVYSLRIKTDKALIVRKFIKE
jgi:hypothetical protein